jgi:hypothetical protein
LAPCFSLFLLHQFGKFVSLRIVRTNKSRRLSM